MADHTTISQPVAFGLIAAGGSNLTYRVTGSAGDRWVLRRPPVGDLLPSAHDVAREHRILQGLHGTAVPVPEVAGLCTDREVTGAPFFVMRYVEGHILRSTAMGEALGATAARTAGVNFFEALACIHTTPPEVAGLGDLSRPDRYVERQLRRWHQQYRQTAGEHGSPLEAAVHDRLAETVPGDVAPATSHLVHGDYHIDNAVFDEQLAVKAIFDWELATLGHPTADLAWALLFWAEPGDEHPFLHEPATQAAGFPSRREAIDVYERASGHRVEALSYFEAFCNWKMACLLSGVLHRTLRGATGGLHAAAVPDVASRVRRIEALFEQARSLAHAG